jgi:hypothetical protein
MIRYFTVTLVTFACLVAFAVAQDQDPAPKKKAAVQKNDPAEPDAKKDDAKKDDPEEAKPKPREDPKKIIEQLREDFSSAREKLEKKDAGEDTRKTQKKIIEGIDKLLDQQDDDSKGGGGGGGGSSNQGGGSSNQGGNSSNQGGAGNQGAGQSKNNDPMPSGNQKKDQNGGKGDSKKDDNGQGKNDEQKDKKKDEGLAKKDDGGGKGDAKKEDKSGGKGASGVAGEGGDAKKGFTPGDLKKDIWGHLPEQRRKEMEAFAGERAMPRYEEMIRAYYNAISESARRKDGD